MDGVEWRGTGVVDREEGEVLWWEIGALVPSPMFCLCGRGRAICLEEERESKLRSRETGESWEHAAEGCQL